MKKILGTALLAAGISFAQIGMEGGTDGLHQTNAKTLRVYLTGIIMDDTEVRQSCSRPGMFHSENMRVQVCCQLLFRQRFIKLT